MQSTASGAHQIVVSFDRPVCGPHPLDGTTFAADRHVVVADRLVQDNEETVLLTDDGEVVVKWPTDAVQQVHWMPVMHRPGSASWLEQVKLKRPAAYSAWSQEEDDRLAAAYAAGRTIKELADLHARTRGAIQSRINRLGLQP
jgi:hypothetical protein